MGQGKTHREAPDFEIYIPTQDLEDLMTTEDLATLEDLLDEE